MSISTKGRTCMKMKKFMAYILSMMMTVSLLTGCGSSDSDIQTTAPSEIVTTTSEKITTTVQNTEETTREESSELASDEESDSTTTEKSGEDTTAEDVSSGETTFENDVTEETTTSDETIDETTSEVMESVTDNEETETTKRQEVITTKRQEVTTTKRQEVTTTKKQEVTTTKKQEVTTTKKQEVTTTKKQEPTTTKKQEPTTTKKQEPTTTKAPEPTTTKAPEPTTTKKQEVTTTKKQEPTTTAPKQEPETTTSVNGEPPITNNYKGYYLDTEAVVKAYKTGDISPLSVNDRAVYKVVVPLINEIKAKYSTDYEREKAVHDWIVLNAEYDYDKYCNGTLESWDYRPYGIFIMKTGVCQAYAEAFELCMLMMDIDCRVVTGKGNGGGHAWNAVKLDGEWYQVDVTWDDPVPDEKGRVYYSYFNITDAMMKVDHEYNFEIPCNGTKYHYESMLNNEYTSLPNYIGTVDEYYAYINERIIAGDTRIEVYVSANYDNYQQYWDFGKIQVRNSPHTVGKSFRYGFDSPDIVTSTIWKMIFFIEIN